MEPADAFDDLPRYERRDYTPHPNSLPGKLRAEFTVEDARTSDFSNAVSGPSSVSHAQTSAIAQDASLSALVAPRPVLTVQIPAPAAVRSAVPIAAAPAAIPQMSMRPGQSQPALHGAAYHLPQPQNLGQHASEVHCPYCGAFQRTGTEARAGDYTLMMSVIAGIFACMWCVPYALNACKDVEHRCSSCRRPLALWHRYGGKVDVLTSTGRQPLSYAAPMQPQRIMPLS